MNKIELQKNIVKYYTNLPTELKDFFAGLSWIVIIQNISVKYSLSEDAAENLMTETTLLLLGIINSEEYFKNIKNISGLSDNKFLELKSEINSLLINHLSEKIDLSYQKNLELLLQEKYGGGKKLDERFSNLPQEVQIAINESNYQATLYKIAEKYQLNIEQMGIFEEITTKVMLGIINPDNYQQEISSKLNIEINKVTDIVKDVNNEILENIKELLKKHWSENNIKEDQVPLPPYKKNIPENKPMIETKPNILEDKLTKPVVSDNSTSIHNLEIKKDSADKSHDPYREII